MNFQEMTVPIGASFMISSTVVGIVIWVFANFERKVDASSKYDALNKRIDSQDQLLQDVHSDVSYIRGRIEPK